MVDFKIKVTTSLLPAELQTPEHADDIAQQAANARKQFEAPNKLFATCLHEAAHWYYLNRYRIPATVIGPAVISKEGKFSHLLGAISLIDRKNIQYSSRVLMGLARSGVAGIMMDDRMIELNNHDNANPLVASLRKDREVVESNDFETFKGHCFDAVRFPYQVKLQPIRYWEKAKIFVARDIKKPETQAGIQEKLIDVFREFVDLPEGFVT